MRTILKGNLAYNKQWWIDKQVECSECRGVFQLEEEDEDKIITTLERKLGGKAYVSLKICPTHSCSGIPSAIRAHD